MYISANFPFKTLIISQKYKIIKSHKKIVLKLNFLEYDQLIKLL
jgi:hypothetical protein